MAAKLRFPLLLTSSMFTFWLGAASPATAATCTVPTQFATIQAAVANPSCTLISVKAGTYTGPVTIDRDLTLRGVGPSSIIVSGVLPSDPDPKFIVRVTGPATNATIEKFTIKGPGGANCNSLQYGILVDSDASATIRSNRITAIRDQPLGGCQNGNAIQVGRQSLATIGHAVITSNRISDYQKTGIVVDNTGSTATITGNVITGSGLRTSPLAAQNGIQISRGADATVSKNDVSDNMYNPAIASSGGILLFQAGNILTIISNTLEGNDVGVWLLNTSNATVQSNTATDSTFDGIALDNAFGPTTFNVISRNTLRRNADGIGLYGADNNRIENNSAMMSDGPGFFADADSTGNTLTGNKSAKNATFGMEDASTGGGTAGTANTYSGNSCVGNGTAKSDPAGLC